MDFDALGKLLPAILALFFLMRKKRTRQETGKPHKVGAPPQYERARKHERQQQEFKRAYKPIEPVIESLERAGAATRVASLQPLLTVKR